MSQHRIDNDIYNITVGWDTRLHTFYALLFERRAKDDLQYKDPSLELGAPREFEDVQEFAKLFEQEARTHGFWGVVIPNELQETLEQDRINANMKAQGFSPEIAEFLDAQVTND